MGDREKKLNFVLLIKKKNKNDSIIGLGNNIDMCKFLTDYTFINKLLTYLTIGTFMNGYNIT